MSAPSVTEHAAKGKDKPKLIALIISGSGPTDRNGNNPAMPNNALKMLAEGLAAKGVSSLRYNKRGMGRLYR